MNKVKTSSVFEEVKIFEVDVFLDFRGQNFESFNKQYFNDSLDVEIDFVQDDFSSSQKRTLRGLHGDNETWKLVSCIFGKIYFVVADMRPESDTYLKWEAFTLTATNPKFILIPPRFANGHLVISDVAVFHYKQSTYYGTKQFTIKHDDKRLDIFWPDLDLIQSLRDSK